MIEKSLIWASNKNSPYKAINHSATEECGQWSPLERLTSSDHYSRQKGSNSGISSDKQWFGEPQLLKPAPLTSWLVANTNSTLKIVMKWHMSNFQTSTRTMGSPHTDTADSRHKQHVKNSYSHPSFSPPCWHVHLNLHTHPSHQHLHITLGRLAFIGMNLFLEAAH